MKRSHDARHLLPCAAMWLAATLLAACAAPAAPPSQELMQADIARYRFGLYRDCVQAGAQSGAPADMAAGFCDCTYETLGRVVPDRDWRLALRDYLLQRQDDERRVLAPYMAQVGACHARPGAPLRDVAAGASYVGRWAYKDERAGCGETFEFDAGDQLRIQSGDERTVNTYQFVGPLNAAGRLEVRTTVLQTTVGRNCAGKIEDLSGQSRSYFIEPGPLGESIAMCESAAGPDCTGPLRKEDAPAAGAR
jgi:hypothetical protein